MSTQWLPSKPIPFAKIKGLRTSAVWEIITEDTTEDSACLTDGRDYLWAYENNGGTWFTRFGMNKEDRILAALSDKFGVEWFSEHDDEFQILASEYSHTTISFDRDDKVRLNIL